MERTIRNEIEFWRLQKLIASFIILFVVLVVMSICDMRIAYYERIYSSSSVKLFTEKQPQSQKEYEDAKGQVIEKVEVQPVEVQQDSVTVVDVENEIWYLAKGIHGEASICDRNEKYRVGTVIMNRLEHTRYPDTVEEVLADGYSCYKDGRWYTEEPTEEELAIARDIYLNGTRVFDKYVIYQAKECYGDVIYESEWHQYGREEEGK